MTITPEEHARYVATGLHECASDCPPGPRTNEMSAAFDDYINPQGVDPCWGCGSTDPNHDRTCQGDMTAGADPEPPLADNGSDDMMLRAIRHYFQTIRFEARAQGGSSETLTEWYQRKMAERAQGGPFLDVERLARAIHADQCQNDQPPCPVDEYDARRLAALYAAFGVASESKS